MQIITIGVLATGLVSTGTAAAATISLLPPLNFLYTAADVLWIGAAAAFALVVCGLFDLVVAVCCIWYAVGRRLKIMKYLVMLMSSHFMIVSFVNFSAVGLIVYGGWYHGVMILGLIAAAITTTALGIMFLLFHKNLRQIGQLYDIHIAKLGESESHE